MANSLTARRRSFVAVQLTLTLADTAYNVLELINAVLAGESLANNPPMVCPDICAHLTFQNSSDNTDSVKLGDALVSATRHGLDLPSAQGSPAVNSAPIVFNSNMNNIQVGGWYAISHTAGQKFHVTVMTA